MPPLPRGLAGGEAWTDDVAWWWWWCGLWMAPEPPLPRSKAPLSRCDLLGRLLLPLRRERCAIAAANGECKACDVNKTVFRHSDTSRGNNFL